MKHLTPRSFWEHLNRRLGSVVRFGLLCLVFLFYGPVFAQGPVGGGLNAGPVLPANHTLHISITNGSAVCGIWMSSIVHCTWVPNGTPVFCDPALNAIMDQYGAVDFHMVSPDSRFLFLRQIYEVKCTSMQLWADLKAYNPQLFPYYTEYTQPEPFLYYPNDTLTAQCNPGDWKYLDYIGAPRAWEIEKGNANKFIGITEEDLDTNFFDLKGKVQVLSTVPGASAANSAHGTGVTNIAVAKTDNGYGMPSIGFNCRAKFRTSSVFSIRDLAARDGVRVTNGSWGWRADFFPNTSVYYEAPLSYLIPLHEAYEYGNVNVFSAGNGRAANLQGGGLLSPVIHTFPASSDYALSVGSIGWEKPYSASYPNGTTNIKDVYLWETGDSFNAAMRNNKVDILAPGQDIWTFGYDTLTGSTIYKKGTGTSAAAPIVAGTVALMQAHNPCLTPYQIEYILKKTAKSSVLALPENLPFAGRLGAGKLEAGKALEKVVEGKNNLPNVTEFGCNSPQTASFEITGMDYNTMCAPGVVNGLKPQFKLKLKGGTPPFRYRWIVTDTTYYKLNAYNVANPILTYAQKPAGQWGRFHFYVTAYDASPIEKVASIQFYLDLTWNIDSFQLAMRDSEHDMMDEPNTMFITDKYHWGIWQSPDLWNRRDNNGDSVHQDPEYFNTDSNYIYTRVRNIGCKVSSPANLKLYWTLASTGERWPYAWNGHDSVNKEPTGKIAGGGYISQNVPVPAILPGASVTVVKGWRPVKPELIKWDPNSGFGYDPHSVHACILARLEEPFRGAPFYGIGMYEDLGVHDNVKRSNNIVTRNLMITNLNPNNRPYGVRRIIINNPLEQAATVTLQFLNDKSLRPFVAGNYGSIGNIEIALGPLFDRWAIGGRQGSGITYVNEENRSIIIDGSEPLRLDNVFLNGNESFDVGVTFKILHNDFYEGQEFLFSLQQFSNPEGGARESLDLGAVQGNVDFMVKLSYYPEVTPQERRALEIPEGTVSKSAGILLYPNPTEKTILIQKTEAYAGKVQLSIVDMTGRVVLVREFEQMGTQPIPIEVGNLVPGMYQAILKEAGGKTWREPFVKR